MTTIPPHNESGDAKPQSARKLGDVLYERGLVTPEQLDEALRIQSESKTTKRLGSILVELHFISEQELASALADLVGTPFSELSTDMVDPGALQCLPTDFIERHNLLPIRVCENWLTIAVEEFTDVFLINDIARRSGCKVQVIAAGPENIRRTRKAALRGSTRHETIAIGSQNGPLDQIFSQIGVDDLKVVEPLSDEETDLEAHSTESPIVGLVNYVIKSAVQACASDIHIEPDERSFRVRYRIDGDLVPSIRPSIRLLPAVVSRIKILAGMDISERRLPQDGGVTITIFDRAVDLRISTMATKFGEKVVIRIVDRDANLRTLDSIGMVPNMLERLRAVVREPNGIVLVTGPTGSGKSTTLYSTLTEIVSDHRNICTIEDPVERIVCGVNQFQVNHKAGFSFASALRSMLRQDPDVIMVGEIRDPETAKLATEAALTGHLVLSTLHTNDAPTAVPRLINMGVEPYLVVASLRGVLAQRLVRRVCPGCSTSRPLDHAQVLALERICAAGCPIESAPVGAGCEECSGTGTLGRIGVFDLMLFNETVLSSFAYGPDLGRLRGLAEATGSTGLLHDGLGKVKQGLIGIDSLLEIVSRTEQYVNEVPHTLREAA